MKFSEIEERILDFWQKNKIFEKSVSQAKNRKYFSFYDGPPFATGKPHYGHILATTIKDAVTRFWYMRGYKIERRVGWDCHGLPIENLIEKETGIKGGKKEIEEKIGIDKFNQSCASAVLRCVDDFQKTLKRVGRWAEYSNAYATMDKEYTESVWWVFKNLFDQGLVYEDFRVTPYCPRCGTPISNFEVNQGYADISDQSIFVKFPVRGRKNTHFLVWTTTPWTLPANLALAIGKKIEYAKVRINNEYFWLAKDRLEILEDYKVVKQVMGDKLLGMNYSALYENEEMQNSYRVVAGDFVSTKEGTGIVHIAPAFGEDDMILGKKEKLPTLITVDLEGKIVKGLGLPGEGKFVKKADEDIKDDLRSRNLLFREEKITHSYPFCWRCDSPLLYYPISSWYVAVAKFKKELVKNNKEILWVPQHLKDGRFGKWLKGARDWSVSRNRFWGAPIPVWKCDCGRQKVVGSIKELGQNLKDLHRPYIDEIRFECDKCGGQMERIPEVFDCWFESGSMPYAQWHYPFENKKLVESTFPADFIAEGMDQTRGWFYTLHVLATGLTLQKGPLGKNKPAFKNCITNGLILGEDGKKLSKRLKNYPDVNLVFEKYGADSLRYFLLSSTPIGEDYILSEKRVAETMRRLLATLFNSYSFFKMYRGENFKPQKATSRNILDKWILSRLAQLNNGVVTEMEKYELTRASRLFDGFVDDLSNWYIRRSRQRFQKPKNENEKQEARQTLYFILFQLSKLIAPFTPFIAEEIYQNLKTKKDKESVHLCSYPKPDKKTIDKKLEERMGLVREIVASALAKRVVAGIKIRQPLASLTIKEKLGQKFLDLIAAEINVKEVKVGKQFKLDTKITADLQREGDKREIERFYAMLRKDLGLMADDVVPELALSNLSFISDEKPENWRVKEFSQFNEGKQYDGVKEIKISDQVIKIGIKK